MKGVLLLAVELHADHRSAFQRTNILQKDRLIFIFRFDSTPAKCCGCSVWAITGWGMSKWVREREQLCLSLVSPLVCSSSCQLAQYPCRRAAGPCTARTAACEPPTNPAGTPSPQKGCPATKNATQLYDHVVNGNMVSVVSQER